MELDKKETARVLVELFRRISRVMHRSFYRRTIPNQKPTAFFVMMRLLNSARHGIAGLRVSEIATAMGITVPAVTQLVTGLEKDGYVRREMDPGDRRAVIVSLTDGGEKILEPAIHELEDGFLGLIDYLGEKDCAVYVKLLQKTERYFQDVIDNNESGARCASKGEGS